MPDPGVQPKIWTSEVYSDRVDRDIPEKRVEHTVGCGADTEAPVK